MHSEDVKLWMFLLPLVRHHRVVPTLYAKSIETLAHVCVYQIILEILMKDAVQNVLLIQIVLQTWPASKINVKIHVIIFVDVMLYVMLSIILRHVYVCLG